MRKTDPKVTRLAGQPLLLGLTARDLDRLSPLFDELSLPAGSVLMRQGFTAGETFLVHRGEVGVTIDGVEVARLGPGELVGEMAVIGRMPRTATVTAISDINVFVVTPRVLHTLVDHDVIGERVAATIAGRTR